MFSITHRSVESFVAQKKSWVVNAECFDESSHERFENQVKFSLVEQQVRSRWRTGLWSEKDSNKGESSSSILQHLLQVFASFVTEWTKFPSWQLSRIRSRSMSLSRHFESFRMLKQFRQQKNCSVHQFSTQLEANSVVLSLLAFETLPTIIVTRQRAQTLGCRCLNDFRR